MENKELYQTLEELRTGQITTNIAMEQILLLFDVLGRSEQLVSGGSRIINWNKIRNKFFNECTTQTPREENRKKINIAPHDMFEWFKSAVSVYVD